jgi:acetyl esterase/lipase
MRWISRWLALSGLFAAGLAAAIPAAASPLEAKAPIDRARTDAQPPARGSAELAYGADPLQRLDFWRATTARPAPLVLFVHGGGWSRGDKRTATALQTVQHFQNAGYAFASMNYRLVPHATVEDQAADVAGALAWLRQQAATLGIDASGIVLMGHSAGAHLVALVGTDPRYLESAGISLSDVHGVIALDGAGYDVARQAAGAGPALRDIYAAAFGTDAARQRALSPVFHAASSNAPAFLILHIDRADGRAQSEALAAALKHAGTAVDVRGVDGHGLRGHMEISRSLGNDNAPATEVVDAWLKALPR